MVLILRGFFLRTIVFFVFLLVSLNSHARVFKFSMENVSAYFAGNLGDASGISDNYFSKLSGADTTFSSGSAPSYTQAVEFGFLMTIRRKLSLKFAAELIKVPTKEGIKGFRADGVTERFTLKSELEVFNPHFTMEFNFKHDEVSRTYFYMGAGWGQMTLKNTYVFTPTGLTDFTNVSADYMGEAKSSFINYHFGLGYEDLFTDNVTFYATLGYRFLDALSVNNDYTGESINGAVTSGSILNDNSSSPLTLSMSGAYIGVGFRFYIDTRN